MDHDEVLEQLELAAVEPDGLARLMAGDTATAAAVAGHLAGCDPCAAEFQRLGRAAPLLRDVVRTTPPADLRERTLAFVRQYGEPRGAAAISLDQPTPMANPSPAGAVLARPVARSRATELLPWVASIAAAVILSVVATTLIVGQQVSQQLAQQDRAISGLEAVTTATIAITAEPDAQRVTLSSTDTDADTSGSLLFSPSTAKLVVVATGLVEPPAGREYRCWVEVDGTREPVGRMFFADDLAYWVGDTPEVSGIGPGTTFGVSLTDLGSPSVDAPPVISGQL